MAIRWKNKILFVAWVLLFTFGLSGVWSATSYGGEYLKNDYFKTGQFQSQLHDFNRYLNMLELSYRPKEQVKKGIVVTPEEINEHRYRYGSLAEQVANIKGQYEHKIQDALQAQNQEVAEIYIAERDAKIEDITNNFKSDEHVRVKIVKEKEERIDKHYEEMEKYRPEFEKLKTQFKYYLKDTATGEVFSNLAINTNTNVDELMSSKNMLFLDSYNGSQWDHFTSPIYFEESGVSIQRPPRSLIGKIGVPKSAPLTGLVLSQYREYQQRQKLFWAQSIASIIALLISILLYKKTDIVKFSIPEKWSSIYKLFPIDICLSIFAFTGLITLIGLSNGHYLYFYSHLYNFIIRILRDLMFTALFLALTVVQGMLLYDRLKDKSNLRVEWNKSLIMKGIQGIKEAFLIRSIGTKVFIIFMIVFAFGAGAVAVLMEFEMILIYIPAFIIIGLPMLLFVIKRLGYFNRIVTNTNELVRGNLEADLPVKGKSPLATLANNINALKHGVKTSRKEQVKSERLKTELITNVSHDLRTPLTSIINYTELLKTPDLTEEDRNSYIQIIDRKSKRLKVLIDDLFEASKMASGNIDLAKEKIDVVQLLDQALAEHNEAILESTLQFRVTHTEKPIYAVVDGQKLWRVFDNLIGNILKYSLENTRVYIAVKAFHDEIIIEFKNVAKYELGQDIDELFERFKRGDTSRHTEGSGLGLAIAKSIIDLHGGSLDIAVDGDLFKVIVSLSSL